MPWTKFELEKTYCINIETICGNKSNDMQTLVVDNIVVMFH